MSESGQLTSEEIKELEAIACNFKCVAKLDPGPHLSWGKAPFEQHLANGRTNPEWLAVRKNLVCASRNGTVQSEIDRYRLDEVPIRIYTEYLAEAIN